MAKRKRGGLASSRPGAAADAEEVLVVPAAAPRTRTGKGQINRLYRFTPVGSALVDALETMHAEKSLSLKSVGRVLNSFDKNFPIVLKDADKLLQIRDKKAKKKSSFSMRINGNLSNYNNAHERWRLDLDQASLQMGQTVRTLDRARLLVFTKEQPADAKKKAKSR